MRTLWGALALGGAVAMGGCKAEPIEAGAPAELTAAPVQAAPVVAPTPAPEAATTEWTVHIATFRDDRLDECADLTADLTQLAPEEAARLKEGTEQGHLPHGAESLKLQRPCVEQFADRTVLATCIASGLDDHVRVTSRFYDIRTIEQSDAQMKSCLSVGGDWQLNADDGAVTSERFRDHVRQFQHALSKMEAAQPR